MVKGVGVGTHSGVGKTVETHFATEKRVRQVTLAVEGCGPIDGAAGVTLGYEIHMGRTTHQAPLPEPLEAGSAATGSVLGTYLHGLFGNAGVREPLKRC